MIKLTSFFFFTIIFQGAQIIVIPAENGHISLIDYILYVAELPGQAKHEPHEQTSGGVVEVFESLRREWARREAITMEKVQIIISELYSQSRGECCALHCDLYNASLCCSVFG